MSPFTTNLQAFMKESIDPKLVIFGEPKQGDKLPNGDGARGVKAEFDSKGDPAASQVWKDTEIEDPGERSGFGINDGYLSISVQPGDERIGDVVFNVQYEGPNRRPDICLGGHNQTLQEFNEWLRDALQKMAPPSTEFEVEFAALPCPKAPFGIDIDAAIRCFLGAKPIVETKPGPENTIERIVEQKLGPTQGSQPR